MKTKLLTFFLVLVYGASWAQAPALLNYQAVVRNSSGQPVANNTPVSLRFSIHDGTAGGTVVYTETQSKTTNAVGVVTALIGEVTALTGVDWAGGAKYLEVEADINNSGSYTSMGNSQLVSVPYALSAGDNLWAADGNDISNVNSGNVGIGTATPGRKLQVTGGGSSTYMQVNNTATGTGASDGLSLGVSGAGDVDIANWENSNMKFFTDNTERMRISGAGNVGIGTTAPSTELDVDGQVRIRGGSPGVGKVLTSDANGLATWETPGNGVAFSAYQSTSQTISTTTKINFNTESYDDGNNFASGEFTAPSAGLYQFNAHVRLSAATEGVYTWIGIYVGNTLYQDVTGLTNDDNYGLHISTSMKLNANDVVSIRVLPGLSATTDTGSVNTWFNGYKIR